MIWFTSDLHLFHDNIVKYYNRQFRNINQMHNTFIKNFNELISENDYLWILGDVAFIGK